MGMHRLVSAFVNIGLQGSREPEFRIKAAQEFVWNPVLRFPSVSGTAGPDPEIRSRIRQQDPFPVIPVPAKADMQGVWG